MDRPARQRLLVSYRCFEPGQRVRLVHDGRNVGEVAAPVSDSADGVLSFDLDLRAGTNALELHFWRWQTRGRPLALLVTGITCIGDDVRHALLQSSAGAPAAQVTIESKQGAPAATS
jgi:hypothetical protein